MESCKTSWKIGLPRTLKLSEFEKRKRLSSSLSQSPTPVSLPPSPTLDFSQDVSVNEDDNFTIEYSNDEQEGSLENGSPESLSESSSDQEEFESVSDNELNFITIEDDDDDDGDTRNTTLKQRRCHRCPTKSKGTIRNEKLYFAHIKRHVQPDVFSCPVCKRTFLKFSYCVSHEIRVHETPLEFSITSIKDSSPIVKAKQYMKTRTEKQTSSSSSQKIDDDEMDPEDVYFYDNRFVKSSSIYPYKGPPVKSIVQCYEIQLFNPNPKLKVSNMIAKRAIEIHRENVRVHHITNMLGTFSRKTVKRRKMKLLAGASTKKRTRKMKPEPGPEKSVKQGEGCGGIASQPACKNTRDNDVT